MEQKNALTGRYSAVQGSFWMGYCVCISFAAVYLQGLGYTNAQLGVVMAVGNLLGAVLYLKMQDGKPAALAAFGLYGRFRKWSNLDISHLTIIGSMLTSEI